MDARNATVAEFATQAGAEEAVRELGMSGFDMRQLSMATCDLGMGESAVGFYDAGDGGRCWGNLGSLRGGVWGRLSGWGYFSLPHIGPVMVAGPLGGWMMAALDNAAIFGGLSALGAALYSIGISKDRVARCEAALRAGRHLVVAHGSSGQVERARKVLSAAGAAQAVTQP